MADESADGSASRTREVRLSNDECAAAQASSHSQSQRDLCIGKMTTTVKGIKRQTKGNAPSLVSGAATTAAGCPYSVGYHFHQQINFTTWSVSQDDDAWYDFGCAKAQWLSPPTHFCRTDWNIGVSVNNMSCVEIGNNTNSAVARVAFNVSFLVNGFPFSAGHWGKMTAYVGTYSGGIPFAGIYMAQN
jgi:hypothetical protein